MVRPLVFLTMAYVAGITPGRFFTPYIFILSVAAAFLWALWPNLFAFGENYTRGRIINILNYKKPAFWVVIVAIIAVVAIGVGLMTDPQKELVTVEDYANQFMQEEVE